MLYKFWFIAILLSSLALGACGDTQPDVAPEGSTEAQVETQAESPASSAEGLPLTDEIITLKMMIQESDSNRVEDFATNEFTKWYEEQTNVHVEWLVIPEGESEQNLQLALAGGELPDVFLNMDVTPSNQAIYGEQGIFLPLNDLIEQYGIHTKAMFEESPLIKNRITTPAGEIYGLPHVNECYHCTLSQRAWINKPWLDALDLEMPETTEELFEVLKAFKEQDPNGNGEADEIPLASATNRWNTNLDGFMMAPFVYSEQFNNNRYLLLEDGTISSAINTDGWREGLRYLNRLHEAGLLEEESFTQSNDYMRSLAEESDINQLGMAIAGGNAVFSQIKGESGRWLEYVVIPPLAGPTGERVTAFNPYGLEPGQCVISAKTEHPELAFRWCDGLYEREATLRANLGREGEDWRWAEEGEVGINGESAIWKRLLAYGDKHNFHWGHAGNTYRSNALRLGETADNPTENLEVILYNETKTKMAPHVQSLDKIIPPLVFDVEQAAELAELRQTITDYIREMELRFILGEADINSDTAWEEYRVTLDSLGLNRYVEIYQAAYNVQVE
ncbi:extracellular solute-binding protein [Anaerolineales bacterium HSG24]|nr:extracellular solute-binding protein [Anaerolineales bacterium HSG24]